jgi:hypothetical protein
MRQRMSVYVTCTVTSGYDVSCQPTKKQCAEASTTVRRLQAAALLELNAVPCATHLVQFLAIMILLPYIPLPLPVLLPSTEPEPEPKPKHRRVKAQLARRAP